MNKIPSSSSDWSALAVDDRFHRKLRNGLFERDRRLTLADDDWLRVSEVSPFCGVVGGDDRALSSAEVLWLHCQLNYLISILISWATHRIVSVNHQKRRAQQPNKLSPPPKNCAQLMIDDIKAIHIKLTWLVNCLSSRFLKNSTRRRRRRRNVSWKINISMRMHNFYLLSTTT